MSRAPRLLPLLLLLCATLFSAACSEPPNTQYLPIGQRCGSDEDCGTSPFNCNNVTYPGGYCERTCTTDGDCPLDAVCASLRCRRKCAATSDCRSTEGHVCRPIGASGPFCDLPLSGG